LHGQQIKRWLTPDMSPRGNYFRLSRQADISEMTVGNLKGARGFSAGHFLRVRGTTIVAEMPALGGLGAPQTSG
jgi:hypothetical protein